MLVTGCLAGISFLSFLTISGIFASLSGFEGAFSHGAVGLGLDLALRAGVPLRDMEFIAHTPLGIKDTNMVLPLGLLHDGATLHEANGNDIEIGDGGLDSLCQAVSHANNVNQNLGRTAGAIDDYNYSKAMKAYAKEWTFEEMNSYLIKPQAYIKGTKMAFAGLRKEKDRASVILYLNQNSDNPLPLP